MSITITVTGAEALIDKFQRYPGALNNNLDRAFASFGVDLLATCKRHASGRPGPNIITGEYVGNMRLTLKLAAEHREVWVTNGSPQARRLEYGFYGVDSLGRVYHQGPFPHMRPAFIETWTRNGGKVRAIPMDTWNSL